MIIMKLTLLHHWDLALTQNEFNKYVSAVVEYNATNKCCYQNTFQRLSGLPDRHSKWNTIYTSVFITKSFTSKKGLKSLLNAILLFKFPMFKGLYINDVMRQRGEGFPKK